VVGQIDGLVCNLTTAIKGRLGDEDLEGPVTYTVVLLGILIVDIKCGVENSVVVGEDRIKDPRTKDHKMNI